MATTSFLENTDWLQPKLSVPNFLSPTPATSTKTPVSKSTGETLVGSNNGGFFGGVGYVHHKLGLGFLSAIEGIWDYTASGIAKLAGADAWAEKQVANDWVNYNSADEWFDPGEGWKVAGDVGGGIGTSVPAMIPVAVAAGITYFSGGTLSPLAAAIVTGSSAAISGFGAAGNATKEAYRETGELTGKEYGYGALVGATEAGVELVSAKIGVGTGRIIKSVVGESAESVGKGAAKAALKNTAKTVSKKTVSTVIKDAGADFLSEAVEEAISEMAAPVWKRATYDPNAENATAGEIAYAAMIGGISGVIMSGANSAIFTPASNYAWGNKMINNGKAEGVLALGKEFFASEKSSPSGIDSWQQSSEIYQKLLETLPESMGEIKASDITTTKQKMLLGELSKRSTVAVMMPEVERSATNLVLHAESAAKTLSEYGAIGEDGKPLSFTAEQIREGVDLSDLNSKKGYRRFRASLHRSLNENPLLARMAVADATGRMVVDTMKFSRARSEVLRAVSDTDLNRFRENATQEELDSLGRVLDIPNWDMITPEQFRAAVEALDVDEKTMSHYAAQRQRIEAAMSEAESTARSVPHTLRRNMENGVYRFGDENANMAVFKEGDSYYIVDYETGYISRELSVSDVNRVLKQVRDGAAASAVSEQTKGEAETVKNAAEISRLALAENGKKRYNNKRRYLQIPSDEYAVISARIIAKNADAKARGEVIGKSGYTQSSNYFYVYENLSDAEFGVIKRIKISNKNLELLSRIRDSLEGTNEKQSNADRAGSNRNASSEGIDKGFGDGDVSADPRGGATAGNDSFLGEQSSQQRGRHNRQGDGVDEGRGRVTSVAIGVWAQENVLGYDKLADPAKTAVRATIRQARAFGIAEEDIKLYASVAARSGLNVVFDEAVQGDALYDGHNTIYVDPDAPIDRMRSKLLLHEGGHVLFARTKKGRRLIDAAYRAIKQNNPDRASQIEQRYKEHYKGSKMPVEILTGIIKEEQGIAYLEDVLGEVDAWSYILAEEPQYESKLISFFAKAAQDYKHLKDMPAEARKLMRQYKKLFAEVFAYNQGNNALDGRPAEAEKAVTSTNEENVHVTGERAALDVGDFRASRYDEIHLEEEEQDRIQSEALTWDVNHRNEMRMRTLSNGIAYQYVIDDEGIVHVYNCQDAVNIHERGERYDNKDGGQPDRFIEKLRFGQGNDGGNNDSVSDGREPSSADRRDHRALRSEGNGDRTGDRQNASYDHKRRKPREYHFDKDGSGHGTVTYSEEQYGDFGWVRENDVLTSGEWKDFEGKFAAALNGQATPQTSRGEFMIAVSNIHDPQLEGINNAIVYATGTIEDPRVSRVLKIDLDNETQLDEQRRNVYALERRGIQQKAGRIFHVYTVTDFRNHGTEQGSSTQVGRHNDELGAERGGSGSKAQGAVGELLPVVKTFSDISGKQRKVLRVGSEYMIEGDSRSKYSPTIKAAIEAENRRIVKRISKEYGRTESWVRRVLERDPTFFDKNGAELVRYALPEDGGKKSYTLKELLDGADEFKPELILRVEADAHLGKRHSVTSGEMHYRMANNFRDKVYTKRAAYQVIREINGTNLLSEKSRTKLAEMLWAGLNRCATTEQRKGFAHDMARYTVAMLMVDAREASPNAVKARQQLDCLRVGLHQLTFTANELARVAELCEQKKAKRLLERWARTEGSRQYPLDLFVSEVAQTVPDMESLDGMDTVEALLEIDKRYGKLSWAARERADTLVFENLSSDEIKATVAEVERNILRAYSEAGTKSKFTRRVEERTEDLSRKAERLREDLDSVKGRDKLNGVLTAQAQRIKELKLGTFLNATQYQAHVFKGSVEALSNIQWRGNTYPARVRKIFGDLTAWYTPENPLLKEQYNGEIAEAMREISSTEGVMSTDELRTAVKIVDHFIHLVQTYNKVWRDGKWVEALPIAKEYVQKLHIEESRKKSVAEKMLRNKWFLKYNETFADPAALSRMMDGYENGFFTEMHAQLRSASLDAQVAEMEIRAEYDAFLKKNKKYLKNAYAEDVEYRASTMPRITLISLYMTMKREHAKAGIAASGFKYKDRKGNSQRVDALVRMDGDVTMQDLIRAVDEERGVIERMLTDADKQYIAILEKVYNNEAKQLKAERDMQRLGFTNALEGYYYPIRRANIPHSVDKTEMQLEIDRVSNASFNKNTVQGAKQELVIESADLVFNRHLRGVCQYAYLSPVVEFYDKIYNLDTIEFANKPVSVATVSEKVWKNGNKYFKKLLADIQGVTPVSDGFSKSLGKIRGNYAKYQLGANPKVWASQLSSFFAAYSQLDADCIARGWFVSAKDVDAYCSLAKLRNYDNAAAEAQGVLDSRAKVLSGAANATNKLGDALMAPIGMVDRFVVTRLFGACQVQVQKNDGAKIGTDANKRAAAALLETVIFETQQNSIATERSGAMRSQNEVARTVTMFSADSMKMMGRVIDGLGEVSAISAKMKDATGDNRVALATKKKQAGKRARKAIAALVVQAAFMAAIAQAFRWLYAKEDEEESVAKTLVLDTLGNMIGGLPIVRDVYSRMTDGYELDNYAYSAVNDLLNAAVAVFDAFGDLFSDSSSENVASSFKKLSYAAGQITGIPTRNIYNLFYGLTKRLAPRVAYRIDDLFYQKNYRTDLYRALEEGDSETAAFMLSLLLDEQIEGGVSERTRTQMLTLLESGHNVLPRKIPTEYSYEGETFTLDEEQSAALATYYSTLPSTLDSLLGRSEYQRLDAKKRAEAFDCVYDVYRELGLSHVTGANLAGNKALVAAAVGTETLVLSQVVTSGIRSDVGMNGKTVEGSKRKKVIAAINTLNISAEQKLLLICAKGYALRDGDVQKMTAATAKKKLLRYILNLKVTKEEKLALAEMCGFEIKNDKIVSKNAFA